MQNKITDEVQKRNHGIIISFFSSILAYIGNLIRNSFFVGLFTDYKSIVKQAQKSKSSVIFGMFSSAKQKMLVFKNKCASYSENSILMNVFDRACKRIFSSSLRNVGIFLLSSGLLILFAGIGEHSDRITALNFSDTFIFGAISALFSLFLITKKNKTISEAICESRLLSYLLTKIFYIKHLDYGLKSTAHNSAATSFIIGVAFGIISYSTSPSVALLLIGFAIYLYLIFTRPENGVLLICLQLPMLSDKLLVFLIGATIASLLFKIARGKRSHNINLCSGAVILLGIVLLSCTLVSFDTYGAFAESLPILIAIILTLTVIMAVRSSALAEKCFKMIGLSALISMASGLISTAINYSGRIESLDEITDIIKAGFSSTFINPESCAAFLIAVIPFFMVKHPSNSRIFSFPALSLTVLCLFLCNCIGAVIALFAALVISILIFNKKGAAAVIILFIVACIAAFALSHFTSIAVDDYVPKLDFLAGIKNISESSAASLLESYGFTGVGFGSEAMSYASLEQSIRSDAFEMPGVYTEIAVKIGIPLMLVCASLLFVFVSKSVSYALSQRKSESAKSICTALFTSVCAIAIFSVYSDFLRDFRMIAMLFLIFGLISATCDSADEDYISPDNRTDYDLI